MFQLLITMAILTAIYGFVCALVEYIKLGFQKLKALWYVPPRGNTDYYGRQITRKWNG